MRLLILTSSYPSPRYPGAGAFVHEMARLLAAAGNPVTVLTPHVPTAPSRETQDGVSVRRFRYAWPERMQTLAGAKGGIMPRLRASWAARLQVPGLMLGFYSAARQLVHTEKFDHILGHWLVPAGLMARVVAPSRGMPYSVFTPGSELTAFGGRLVPILRPVLSGARTVFGSSDYVMDLLRSVFPDKPLVFFPMGGVNLSDFPYRSERAFAEPLKLLTVGRLVSWKGTTHALAAVAKLRERGVTASLTIVGEGPMLPVLRGQVEALNLNPAVRFRANLDHAALVQAYHDADVLIQPSIEIPGQETEGLGVTLLEAQATGTNVVASRVGGITTAVADGETGTLVPQADPDAIAAAILDLYGHPALRARYRAAARARIERKFAWNTLIPALLDSLADNAPASTLQHANDRTEG